MIDFQTSPTPLFTSPEDAAAQARPEKVHPKATRRWFTKVRIIVPLALIIVFAIIQVVHGEGEPGASDTAMTQLRPSATGELQANGATAGIGTKVRDGTFEFVVTGVERPGRTFPGKLNTTLTAKGEFVIVRVNVTNVGNEPKRVDCACQYLLNDKGQAVEPSSAILYTREALKFVQLIHPGITLEHSPVIFDVVPGTKIASIELHGSPTSPGVRVKLS